MKIYIFGNGNLSFEDFLKYYVSSLQEVINREKVSFLICDFRGTDTLMMEFLKCASANVTVYHIGEKPRYIPDNYKTKVSEWELKGGFNSDKERDTAAINDCTHFLAYDFNSDENRKSGTLKNIELCLDHGKIEIKNTPLY